MATKTSLSYGERAQSHPNALARRLFEIAESKQTNITVSADLTTTDELLSIAEGRVPFVQCNVQHLLNLLLLPPPSSLLPSPFSQHQHQRIDV